jgi:hypothetical protein
MSTITEDEKQARIAEFKKIPRPVRTVVLLAFALGTIACVRVLARSHTAHLPLGKAVFYGLLMLAWFWLTGGSLYTRSRWGFVGLIALSVLPLLGLLGLSVHLLRLALEGALTASWPETIHCSIGVVQLILMCVLLRYLLAKQVRDYVWKPAA